MLLFCLGCCLATTAPTWPTNYIVAGVLQLPYAEIKEPFLAFFDGSHNRSKISYYNGKPCLFSLLLKWNFSFRLYHCLLAPNVHFNHFPNSLPIIMVMQNRRCMHQRFTLWRVMHCYCRHSNHHSNRKQRNQQFWKELQDSLCDNWDFHQQSDMFSRERNKRHSSHWTNSSARFNQFHGWWHMLLTLFVTLYVYKWSQK